MSNATIKSDFNDRMDMINELAESIVKKVDELLGDEEIGQLKLSTRVKITRLARKAQKIQDRIG